MRAVLVTVLSASSALAQTIWNVPNGADVAPFISQASPGDIIQLGAQHEGFVVNKGVVIVGQANRTVISGPYWFGGTVSVAVPAGQRASLMRLSLRSGSDGYSTYWASLGLQSGQSVVADVDVTGSVSISGGFHIVHRLSTSGGSLQMNGGLCELTDSTLHGRNEGGWPPHGNTVAMSQSAGTLVASRLVVGGGHGLDQGFMVTPPLPAAQVSGGTAYFTDCALTGGNGSTGPNGVSPGAAALIATNSSVAVARTTLTPGVVGPGAASSGHQQVDAMVGMSCLTAPTLGAAFQVTATAGDSQDLFAIVGGFDATPSTLSPIVEPLIGSQGQLAVLVLAIPAAGAQIPCTVTVPNAAWLYGVDVWLQAIQRTATNMRASAVVGGTIR